MKEVQRKVQRYYSKLAIFFFCLGRGGRGEGGGVAGNCLTSCSSYNYVEYGKILYEQAAIFS